ncbi:hypothetical protein [Flaviaesturariibacter aridisoli]|uniref:Uncharacterized protein n=1 Tax=Flaviaesturariibacter aridisoli TaxID=2545761 RepID=A0A4R4DWX5_9BACT|nr:hypothetical protein [Flaviaesturariibacter aridisoli]TCZ67468.1 hypothetical protein E0486_15420 [Flaviaesturariibacter aridisoli]
MKHVTLAVLGLFIFFTVRSQQLTLKELVQIRTSEMVTLNKFFVSKEWEFIEAKKSKPITVFGYFGKDRSQGPISLVGFGTESHLSERAVTFFTMDKPYFLMLLKQLQASPGGIVKTVTKGTKTIDFYVVNNSVVGNKRNQEQQPDRYTFEIYSMADFKSLFEKL